MSSTDEKYLHPDWIPRVRDDLDPEARIEVYRNDDGSLHSANMVAAASAWSKSPLHHDELRSAFYRCFPKAALAAYWETPDAEFDRGLADALASGSVSESNVDGRPAWFLSTQWQVSRG